MDIPEINTLLLLRPTQSPVIFQQQIGRGLRLADGKESCLVLDFVGLYAEGFRFDTLFRAITGQTRAQLKDAVENGFGLLPTGCYIQFDRVARERVLTSLRAALQMNARRIKQELGIWAANRPGQPLRMEDFLRDNEFDIGDLYANKRSWTSYKRDANLPVPLAGPREVELSQRMGSILHANDPNALDAWTTVLTTGEIDETRVQMLAHQILHSTAELIDPAGFTALIQAHPALRDEMLELVNWLREDSAISPRPLPDAPSDWPLTLHARYERREIQTAVAHITSTKRPRFSEGCLLLKDEKIELMFVTLDKREGFAERLQFHDYAVSPTLFHWQTQNMAGAKNASGRRYLDSDENGWGFQLFVREDAEHAFVALGPVKLESHEGDKPISIVWRLKHAMPIEIFRRFSVLRSA